MAWLAWKSFIPKTTDQKKKKKRVEIFNIRNPICSFFAPSAYTNITNAGRLPGEDADTRVHDF